MGADVIKIEPPGGGRTRRLGPYHGGAPHPEKSLFWKAYNYNKRGVTLDPGMPDGRRLFEALARSADFVMESFEPGHLDSLGLGYSALSRLNSAIILVSMTGFGQTGPRSHHKAPELVAMARGGVTITTGDDDRPPTTISFPQAALNAATDGALGAVMAHYFRGSTGQGQHVDISMQQSLIWVALGGMAPSWDLMKSVRKRSGAVQVSPRTGTIHRSQWPCKDGWITFDIRFAGLTGTGLQPLFDWMAEARMLPEGIRELGEMRMSMDIDAMDKDEYGRINQALGDFFQSMTAQELLRGAEDRQVMLLPVFTAADVLGHRQNEARGAFNPVEDPDLGPPLSYPTPMAKLEPPGLDVRLPAPSIGRHNEQVYSGELGLSRAELVALYHTGAI